MSGVYLVKYTENRNAEVWANEHRDVCCRHERGGSETETSDRGEGNIYSHSFGASAVSSNASSRTAHRPHPALFQPLAINQAFLLACFALYLCVHLLQMLKKKKTKKPRENPFPEWQITIPPATPCKQRGGKGSSVKCSLMCSN